MGKQHVLIIPDGAGDVARVEGLSPLAAAHLEHTDFVAREGVCGLMQTLYDDLPRSSIVAQLGMLGWDPRHYFPHGRASCELLALDSIAVHPGDLCFRASLVRMEDGRLASYNADYIVSEEAEPLLTRVRQATEPEFPDFELYHNADFRNTLVVRQAEVEPRSLVCPEPHESVGLPFATGELIAGSDAPSRALARRINRYLARAARVLEGARANMIFPWSPSGPFVLTPFREHMGFAGRAVIVGCMDFLHGIAKASGMEFVKVGNGRPDTDYAGKGRAVLEHLEEGYELVVCHVNGPDEAGHMGDLALKVRCLERIDASVVAPVVEYFRTRPERLGGVMVAPDHYTNFGAARQPANRTDAHSTHPVPFALWNGRDRDDVARYDEDHAAAGRFGHPPLGHLQLLPTLGIGRG